MFRGLLLGLLAAYTAAQSTVTVSDCAPGSLFTITDLGFSPSAPIPGQSGTLLTSFKAPVSVESGKTRYTCTLNGLPVYDETLDLCSQTACPITAGDHSEKSISAVPDTTGKVICNISWRNNDDKELLCIQMVMKLVKYLRA
jgi:hypothetical protein